VKRVCSIWCLVLLYVVATQNGVEAGEITCHAIRYTFLQKNLDISDVPKTTQQGIHLQICPRGETCCTPEMESKLWTVSREGYSAALASTTSHLQATFQTKAKLFGEFFTDLLANSKRDFHLMFKKTYGILYERNSDVFTDFFKDLEAYYDEGRVDLEEALRRFFTQLYQRMFTVLNSQHTFDEQYLQCVSLNMKKLQPFGDVPKKLTLQLRRSFVATRTFAQALLEGKRILTRVLKIAPSDACTTALTRMMGCPACQRLPAIRPCSGLCLNVMKGCLAHHTELTDSWDRYIDSLIAVGERLIGPFNIEAVVDPIDIKISDAIMNFQESGIEVTKKVFEDCGNPRRGRRQANGGFGYNTRPSAGYNHPVSGYNHPMQSSGGNIDNLVNDILTAVKDTKGFWTKLPYIMCQNPDIGSGKDKVSSNCWNGRERGGYNGRVTADGLVGQDVNPEVSVDTSTANTEINEQIFALRLVINKLENAYNGHAVDWPHYEPKYPNDSGYYGSGDCYDDEDCEGSGGEGSGGYGDSGEWEGEEGSGSVEDNAQPADVPKAWPPWKTTAKPATGSDIDIVDSPQGTPEISRTGGGSSLHLAVVYFTLPVLLCFLGAFF